MANLAAQIPLIGGLFDSSQQQAMDQLAKNQALYSGLQMPEFSDYKPTEYDPTMAQANTISEDPSLKSAQMSALSKLAGLADTGLSAVDQQGFERARELGNQISNSGTAAALQNAQARGVGGSGLEFAMREMAGQNAAGRAQDAGLSQASQSAQQRALYNQAYGNALSGVRGQDFSANSANANILNNFNQYNTSAKNQAAQYNVGQQNSAQQYNNGLRQQGYQDQLQKLAGMSGANNGMAQGYAAQDAANTAARNSNTQLGMAAGMAMAGAPPVPKQSAKNGYAGTDDASPWSTIA